MRLKGISAVVKQSGGKRETFDSHSSSWPQLAGWGGGGGGLAAIAVDHNFGV